MSALESVDLGRTSARFGENIVPRLEIARGGHDCPAGQPSLASGNPLTEAAAE